MEKAVFSTSLLGYMLRDLNCEFGSRFVDELLLKNRNAKALATPLITTRASMGAHIGEGNCHLAKYSLLAHIYILLQVTIEEVQKMALATDADNISTNFEEMLSRPATYNRIKCFPNEISPIKLATAARNCFQKYKNDYKIGSFINLVEWRCKKAWNHRIYRCLVFKISKQSLMNIMPLNHHFYTPCNTIVNS